MIMAPQVCPEPANLEKKATHSYCQSPDESDSSGGARVVGGLAVGRRNAADDPDAVTTQSHKYAGFDIERKFEFGVRSPPRLAICRTRVPALWTLLFVEHVGSTDCRC